MIPLERSLAKLTISAYVDRDLKRTIGSMTAMYNPDSLQLSYQTTYNNNALINSSILSNNYAAAQPGSLSLSLVFDARMPGNTTPLEQQLTRLRQLCYDVNPSRGEPHFLKIKWGQMRWADRGYFAGRMVSLGYSYSLFDRDATPLRATANLTLTADPSIDLQQSQQRLESPPARVVKVPAGGEGLALIAASAGAAVAGGGVDYLGLAWHNELNNLNDIAPGQVLRATGQTEGQG